MRKDPRNADNGIIIYEAGYCDQPYVVIAKDGTWVCTFTTSQQHEGARSQYIAVTTSKDLGRTWSDPVAIEDPNGPEASWAMPFVNTNGRIYVFYVYNGDNVHTLPDGTPIRADMLGWYCYRYSDDNGKTWSERYRLPVRITACDRTNQWNGKVQIFWGIGKPIICHKSMFFSFTKIGRYMLDHGEGWFFRSDNILYEADISKIDWQMLPDGEYGVRSAELGSVQEEHNIVALSNGDLYCAYRTATGYVACSYSRDGGHSWSKPKIATFANGRPIKNPRACPRIWRTIEGNYLLWFHNHSGKDFANRNPVWISGGIEKDGSIIWSEPEIILYSYDHSYETGRFSYPDLIQTHGRYWVTTSQKTRITLHEIDPNLFEGLWMVHRKPRLAKSSTIFSAIEVKDKKVTLPHLLKVDEGGFTIELKVRFDDFSEEETIIDSRDPYEKGFCISKTRSKTLKIDINDGKNNICWECDQGLLSERKLHHITIIVDSYARVIMFLVDGILCDGGRERQYGWKSFDQPIGDINTSNRLRISETFKGTIESLRIYNRRLYNFEVMPNDTTDQL